MKGGTITIMGNVEHWLGQYMHGGEIVVKGNAKKNAVGNLMEGGRIILLGDAGELFGWEMQAGEIWIKGSIRRS
jgi:formylmethanofuran dehydrogenase subunit C